MDTTQEDAALWAEHLIASRRTTLPKRLEGTEPSPALKQRILQAAASAPDHDQILPWRFIEVPTQARSALAEAFAQALLERDPQARPEDVDQAREKAHRSPWLLLAVARTGGLPDDIPAHERLISAGAAIQNILLMATALGLGSCLTSGKATASTALRQLFQLTPDETALCFISVGHIRQARAPRPRPAVDQYCSVLSLPEQN